MISPKDHKKRKKNKDVIIFSKVCQLIKDIVKKRSERVQRQAIEHLADLICRKPVDLPCVKIQKLLWERGVVHELMRILRTNPIIWKGESITNRNCNFKSTIILLSYLRRKGGEGYVEVKNVIKRNVVPLLVAIVKRGNQQANSKKPVDCFCIYETAASVVNTLIIDKECLNIVINSRFVEYVSGIIDYDSRSYSNVAVQYPGKGLKDYRTSLELLSVLEEFYLEICHVGELDDTASCKTYQKYVPQKLITVLKRLLSPKTEYNVLCMVCKVLVVVTAEIHRANFLYERRFLKRAMRIVRFWGNAEDSRLPVAPLMVVCNLISTTPVCKCCEPKNTTQEKVLRVINKYGILDLLSEFISRKKFSTALNAPKERVCSVCFGMNCVKITNNYFQSWTSVSSRIVQRCMLEIKDNRQCFFVIVKSGVLQRVIESFSQQSSSSLCLMDAEDMLTALVEKLSVSQLKKLILKPSIRLFKALRTLMCLLMKEFEEHADKLEGKRFSSIYTAFCTTLKLIRKSNCKKGLKFCELKRVLKEDFVLEEFSHLDWLEWIANKCSSYPRKMITREEKVNQRLSILCKGPLTDGTRITKNTSELRELLNIRTKRMHVHIDVESLMREVVNLRMFFEKIQQENDKACTRCMRVAKKLKKCSRCKMTRYCSKDCQTNDWKKHKKFCCYVKGLSGVWVTYTKHE